MPARWGFSLAGEVSVGEALLLTLELPDVCLLRFNKLDFLSHQRIDHTASVYTSINH